MRIRSVSVGLWVFSVAVLFFLSGAVCFANPRLENNGVVSKLTDIPKLAGIFQDNEILPQSDQKIGYVIQVKGDDGLYWYHETDATDKLEVQISYKFFETIESGGDRFVVVNTPMEPPLDWFSFCCPEHFWFHGLQGESFNRYNATEDWITEVVLSLNVQGLPFGTYTFYHAYDRNPNGLPDFESLVYDFAVVHVKSPISVTLSADPLSGPAPLEVTFQPIVNDPKNIKDTCNLVVGGKKSGCAAFNIKTLESEGVYQAWVEVTDIYGREVKSNTVMIHVDANDPPTVSNLSVKPQMVQIGETFVISYDYDDPDGLDDVKEHHVAIGTESFTYEALGSGSFESNYRFLEGSSEGKHFIDVYVTDQAGLNSNVLSSVVELKVAEQCGTFTESGHDEGETHIVELGQSSGVFQFDYNTYSQEDHIIIWYEGRKLKDFGCLGTGSTQTEYIFYEGSDTKIKVEVIPNCFGGTGTDWNFTVHCPS